MQQVYRRIFIFIYLFLSITQCDDGSDLNKTDHLQLIDKVPEHILDVENLKIFESDVEAKYSLRLVADQVYGKIGEPFLSTIQGCIVDNNDRVIILDVDGNYNQALYTYNEDGTYYGKIGSFGNGPGEYKFIGNLEEKNGIISILDAANLRLIQYSTENYTFLKSESIENFELTDHKNENGFEFSFIMARSDGNYIVFFDEVLSNSYWPIQKLLLMDFNGNRLNFEPIKFRTSPKSLGELGGMMPTPFMGKTIIDLSSDGTLFSVWSHDFLIKTHDSLGVHKSAFYYPLKGTPFDIRLHTPTPFYTANDVSKALSEHDIEYPESNPIIEQMVIDDENRIWIAIPTYDELDEYEWWVLEESGVLLAKLRLSKHQPIYEIKNGYLYSKKIDVESGTEYIIRYKLQFSV